MSCLAPFRLRLACSSSRPSEVTGQDQALMAGPLRGTNGVAATSSAAVLGSGSDVHRVDAAHLPLALFAIFRARGSTRLSIRDAADGTYD
eukprot:CAMPEP_0168409148 /NCGR_PEP_ID=MMETSP0228-20121227/27037_1 /TAXON_ID=133427 /ORGANISM="Protoceratium reticulatum, Strain CCCM 535 (=CCMP 1889)" /LENGTH=89 /DNA_ID=CAMNT_0008422857 /DNA_START=335 /DNA_END=601 /DNA_ORIENTATION=+